jgi:hypothetical protein
MVDNVIINNDFFKVSDVEYVIKNLIDKHLIRQDLIDAKFKWSKYLKNYLYLTYAKNATDEIPTQILYINRYFWFDLFYYYYKKDYGVDAGIEQQMGQLIEDMCNNIKETDFDWNIFERIHNKILNEDYMDIMNE